MSAANPPSRAARPLRLVVALAGVGLAGWAITGLVTRDDPAPAGPATPGEVAIADFKFAPTPQKVSVGSTLTWSNSDKAAHTVDSQDKELDSESIGQGETYEHTFDAAGTYEYFCAFHPFMKGVVEVTG